MMKGRKTIEVEEMWRWANGMLAYDGHGQGYKAGVCTMIEKLLMKANRYEGYHYIDGGGEYGRQYYLRDTDGLMMR